jgi:histidine triad (HIT) family protein
VCYDHFLREGSDQEILCLNDTILKVIDKLKLSPFNGEEGYRIISNAGTNGVQDVPHLHIHILGGKPLGRMLGKD